VILLLYYVVKLVAKFMHLLCKCWCIVAGFLSRVSSCRTRCTSKHCVINFSSVKAAWEVVETQDDH